MIGHGPFFGFPKSTFSVDIQVLRPPPHCQNLGSHFFSFIICSAACFGLEGQRFPKSQTNLRHVTQPRLAYRLWTSASSCSSSSCRSVRVGMVRAARAAKGTIATRSASPPDLLPCGHKVAKLQQQAKRLLGRGLPCAEDLGIKSEKRSRAIVIGTIESFPRRFSEQGRHRSVG